MSVGLNGKAEELTAQDAEFTESDTEVIEKSKALAVECGSEERRKKCKCGERGAAADEQAH
jgi:hypothetical protein